MPLYQRFINEMKKGKRVQKNGRVIRKTTIKNYVALQKNLEGFEKAKGRVLRFKDDDLIRTTREKKAERNYWKKFYFSFTEYLFKTRNVHDNYAGSQIKLLRAFFNYQIEEGYPKPGRYHDGFYITSQDLPAGRQECP